MSYVSGCPTFHWLLIFQGEMGRPGVSGPSGSPGQNVGYSYLS